MTDHAELRRLFARLDALKAETREVEARIAEAGNRVSIAAGYRVMLRGENLKRLVEGGVA